ncbi:DUF4383 domain-containing protein [Shimia ponticola]|uniref:DUF4383 domain-containing protein n=1 Tax=Shimia ponticola TaxID=2582893 RepID=UPI0011BFD433|nr:DUF4383 domain-containing protein [Shimia ponticola]
MTSMQKLCLAYVGALLIAASLNYVPGLTDAQGRAFGIFALDIYDDALHVASALWALVAALVSHRAARMFMLLFGLAYLGDGVFGFFTGYGYLDLGIFTNASEGMNLSLGRVLANAPHLILGGIALWAGVRNIGRPA